LSTNDTPQTVNVTVFDFKSQLLSLINHSSLFNDLDNLDVNPKNRFGKYESENHILSSVNSGNRYELAYNTLIKDPEKDFLMPIIFACDETKVSSQGEGSCWPLLFTTSILNQSSRSLPTAWKPLGYIYDTSLLASQHEEQILRKPLKSLRLHQLLKAILESFVKCQNDDSLHDIELFFAGKSKRMNIYTYCHVVNGDMQGVTKCVLQLLAIQFQ
jgi:putative ubiquitin-RnfH superfamily antitoxin RatB of RatAB toxin-antitoxin module